MRGAHVVIIGAGAAGAVTAYRLRKLLGAETRITILEASARVGGRAQRVRFAGADVEVGGSILHTRGRRLGALAEELGVETASPRSGSSIAVWTGTDFAFASDGEHFDIDLVERYGVERVKALAALTHESADRWGQVYDLQDAGAILEGPRWMLMAMGAEELTAQTLEQHLADGGVTGDIVTEFVAGALGNIYNQGVDVNAFAGTVALAGIGLAGGSLYSIADGNERLFAAAIAASDVDLRTGTRVRRVSGGEGDFLVETDDGTVIRANAVVIACPPTGSIMEVEPVGARVERRYVDVEVTLVAGEPAPEFYSTDAVPDLVLATGGEPGFTSCGVVGRAADGRAIRKIFSPERLPDDYLHRLFREVGDVWRTRWQAYPAFPPLTELPRFQIAPGVFDVSAMEVAASTMEHQATAAWSVAGLVRDHLGQL